MRDELNFKNANNSCLSLHVIAERVRTKEAAVLIAVQKPNGILEIKIEWPQGKKEPRLFRRG